MEPFSIPVLTEMIQSSFNLGLVKLSKVGVHNSLTFIVVTEICMYVQTLDGQIDVLMTFILCRMGPRAVGNVRW